MIRIMHTVPEFRAPSQLHQVFGCSPRGMPFREFRNRWWWTGQLTKKAADPFFGNAPEDIVMQPLIFCLNTIQLSGRLCKVSPSAYPMPIKQPVDTPN